MPKKARSRPEKQPNALVLWIQVPPSALNGTKNERQWFRFLCLFLSYRAIRNSAEPNGNR